MSVAERLGGLGGVCPDKHRVAVGQVQDEEVDPCFRQGQALPLHSAYDSQCLSEVALRLSGRMHERHEHLTCPAAVLSDVVLDDRVPAVEAVLVPQSVVDALGSVALLPGKAESLPRT